MNNISKQEKPEMPFKTYKKSWVPYVKTLIFIGLFYYVVFALIPISLADSFVSWLVLGFFILNSTVHIKSYLLLSTLFVSALSPA